MLHYTHIAVTIHTVILFPLYICSNTLISSLGITLTRLNYIKTKEQIQNVTSSMDIRRDSLLEWGVKVKAYV